MEELDIILKSSEPLITLFRTLLGTLSFPADVVWRHHQGERICTWWRIVLHLILIYGMAVAMPLPLHETFHPNDSINQKEDQAAKQAAAEAKKSGSFFLQVFDRPQWTSAGAFVLCSVLVMVAFLGCLNLLEIRNKRINGVLWHSKFYGQPRFLPDSHLSNAWVIPLGTLAFGLWSGCFIYGLGNIICFYALMQVFSYRLEEHRLRQRWLDEVDRKITTIYMRKAIEQWQEDGTTQSQVTHGVSVQGLLKTDERKVFDTDALVNVLDERKIRSEFASLLTPQNQSK